jgi:fluoride ion exporter CrcB/FEX
VPTLSARLTAPLHSLSPRLRRATPRVALGVALAVGPLTAWASTKPDETALIATFGAFWVTLSIYLYQFLRRRLPTISSVAVVAIAWGVLAALTSLTSHPCDVANITQASCSTSEVANSTLAAMIMPFLPLLIVLPFVATRGLYRAMSKTARKTATWVRGKH